MKGTCHLPSILYSVPETLKRVLAILHKVSTTVQRVPVIPAETTKIVYVVYECSIHRVRYTLQRVIVKYIEWQVPYVE